MEQHNLICLIEFEIKIILSIGCVEMPSVIWSPGRQRATGETDLNSG